jgi:drug/metabolite transporter (DMT)-like permease
MPRITLYTGALLIFLGIVFYELTGSKDATALIPCWFGLALAICGSLAGNGTDRKLKLFMHIAVSVALLGFLTGAILAIRELIDSGGFPLIHPHTAEEQVLMALICQVFAILCIRSFLAARRSRGGSVN